MSMQQPGTPAPQMHESERIAKARKTYNMIWMALLAATAVYGYVAFFILKIPPSATQANKMIIIYILLGVVVCETKLGFMYFISMTKPEKLDSIRQQKPVELHIQTAGIICMACCEAVSILGLVLHILGFYDYQVFTFFLFSAVTLVVHKIQADRVWQSLEDKPSAMR
jgi:F0F1-type ATP synthase membrane subunit c/vacuolar-type H+-ATPase subunit K